MHMNLLHIFWVLLTFPQYINHFLYCDTWSPKLFFPSSLLCFFMPHQFEVGARGTSVSAWASGGGPKNVLRRAEVETKKAALCDGPGQPSSLQTNKAKGSIKSSHPVFILFLFHRGRKIKHKRFLSAFKKERFLCNFSESISQLGFVIYKMNTIYMWNDGVWITELFVWLKFSQFPPSWWSAYTSLILSLCCWKRKEGENQSIRKRAGSSNDPFASLWF